MVVSNYEGLSKSPREQMTTEYIRELIVAFADAARRGCQFEIAGEEVPRRGEHQARIHRYVVNEYRARAALTVLAAVLDAEITIGAERV